MIALLWLKGLVTYRSGRLLGALAGVALTVALLVSVGAFVAASAATMTRRAAKDVAVDWQVLLAPGADPQAVTRSLDETVPTNVMEPVGYADVAGLSATTGGTVQTTGPGKVLGLPPGYRQHFPAELRLLVGSLDGVLVAQQTAANLHVGLGDVVMIQRMALPPVEVTVAGVVDLPYADSLFQAVGIPPGTAPQAPPDNVLLLPEAQWHALFDLQAAVRPDSVRTQLHVRLAATLPPDPGAAFTLVEQLARHLEARIAGSGIVGNNLAARLDGVRADALYARVLFLFLGAPGVLLAILLTLAVAASGAIRRRQEQALLRVRGASSGEILQLESMETLVVGVGGVCLGLAVATAVTWLLLPEGNLFGSATLAWTLGAALGGLALAAAAVLLPAWQQARHSTVAAARRTVRRGQSLLWQRLYLDFILLAVAAVMYWRVTRTGYQVVLAPEGVPQAAVSYEAFLAPLGLWLGGALLAWRLWSGWLARGRRELARLLHPLTRGLEGIVVAALARQRVLLTWGVVLVALALAFAISTALFNTTYNAQAQVDAALTNGADVTVRGSTAAPPGSRLADLAALPGVAAAQLMQHRFAYVGNDLQDLYGIDPAHMGEATAISDAYFANGNARSTLAALAAQADGVLVSQETVTDFQLRPGDLLNLRLQNAQDHQYHIVPFHFIGVVREFPTAPTDSFLVANASYVAEQTGTAAAEIVLLRVSSDPAAVAEQARRVVSDLPGVKVTDINETQRVISSSLTSVDLHGLTRLELSFALLLVIGAAGLVLALSLLERRRSLAILAALGARHEQLAAFVWGEGMLILAGGALTGSVVGVTVAHMLVAILKGVFDPPPEVLTVPWGYLALLGAAAVASTLVAITSVQWVSRRLVVESLREL